MRRVVLLSLFLILSTSFIRAQSGFTSVTGQVKDSNSVPYANCAVTANFVDATGVTTRAATINGSPIPSRTIQSSCDANGNFTIVVEDSAVVVPLGTTWQFTFSYTQHATGLPNPSGQPQAPSFTYTAPICPNANCITGASINITSQISSLIPQVSLILLGNISLLGLNNTWSGTTNTFSGSLLCKNFEGIACADQYSPGTVTAPASAAGLGFFGSNGSVAANSYRCEVTYNGSTTGETTPSPASLSVTTMGATSWLFCEPPDEPAGASSYNTYWQTAGAGSYWRGHTSVAFGSADVQTTTPPTSGTNPPISNTATSPLAAAQAFLASGPGGVLIPSTMSATGQTGDPAPGQMLLDFRTGSIFASVNAPSQQRTTTVGPGNQAWSLFAPLTSPFTGTQFTGFSSYLDAEATPSFSKFIPAAFVGPNGVPALVSGSFMITRSGTRSEHMFALNPVANCVNTLGFCVGEEIDINNSAAAYNNSSQYNNGLGLLMECSSTSPAHCYDGVAVGGNATFGSANGQWTVGLEIFNDSFVNSGIRVVRTTLSPNDVIEFDSFAANVDKFIYFKDNAVTKWINGMDGSQNYLIQDVITPRLRMNNGANSISALNATGTAPVRFNQDTSSGTGGVEFWNGGATPAKTAAVTSGGQFQSLLATGTAPLSITSTTPVANLTTVPATYNASGTQTIGAHLVYGTCTLGTNCGVTLSGSAVYTSSSSYVCTAADQTGIFAARVNQTSGSAFTITGNGTDVIGYTCTGN